MIDQNFMGKNGMVWWFGTVESNADPEGIGRCRVRIDGWHTENDEDLPTDCLPFAFPILPITNTGTGGVGETPVGPCPGTRVYGFFLDGHIGMNPAMVGVLAGRKPENAVVPKAVEYGSTNWLPNTDDLISPTLIETEDCPTGYPATQSINLSLPDPRTLELNPSEWAIPFTGFVNSAYGERGGQHYGVDICPAGIFKQQNPGAPHVANVLLGPTGLPCHAAADGEVVFIWTADKGSGGRPSKYDLKGKPESRSFGNAIAIRHTLSTGTYTTIYAHLGISQDPAKDKPGAGILVKVGDKVKRGQLIGYVGRSHNREQLTHLHFEIRVGAGLPRSNNHINPGRIFPQLLHKHEPLVSWCKSRNKYDAEPELQPSSAPVIALEGPK